MSKEKEEFELHIQWLDNGIILSEPSCNLLLCEKFSNDGGDNDDAMHKFLGRNLWLDVKDFCCRTTSTNVKITIQIEEE